MPLKLMLVSPRGTVYQDGKARHDVLDELVLLIQRLTAKGVQVALWSNHKTTIDDVPLEAYLSERAGSEVALFQANSGDFPARQKGGSVDPILAAVGVQRHETILVGNGETDLRAGVNNKLLQVRPEWYENDSEYGFPVSSIGALARFCEVFALREHPIYWSVDDGTLKVRAMGPFSTYKPEFAQFGADAKAVAKQDVGDRRFWFQAVVSSLYFSGIAHAINYICAFPGHSTSSTSKTRKGMDAVLTTLGKCFRTTYFPNLLIRHTTSIKSQTATADQKTFRNQVNTIHLNRRPREYDKTNARKTAVSLAGKTVLVVDDFCTHGRSLDAARAYIEAAGGQAILFSWLKTVNTSFKHMRPNPALAPFEANNLEAEPNALEFGYREHIVDLAAPGELDAIFNGYKAWKWPG